MTFALIPQVRVQIRGRAGSFFVVPGIEGYERPEFAHVEIRLV
jgi:hypothetical protein